MLALAAENSRLLSLAGENSRLLSLAGENSRLLSLAGENSRLLSLAGESARSLALAMGPPERRLRPAMAAPLGGSHTVEVDGHHNGGRPPAPWGTVSPRNLRVGQAASEKAMTRSSWAAEVKRVAPVAEVRVRTCSSSRITA